MVTMLVIPDSITYGQSSCALVSGSPSYEQSSFDEILNQVQNDKFFSSAITYY